MRKLILLFLLLSIAAYPQETRDARRARRGQSAGYASRDATAVSMMGWGLGIATGIALLCALIDNNDSTTAH